MRDLVIIAHPDDELIWFSSILFRNQPDVICVTSGRDAKDKAYREKGFSKVMKMLGIENYHFLGFPDTDDRLHIPDLENALKPFAKKEYRNIYTHGPFGEIFNHMHHQDICYAVHKLFEEVYSVAWNIYPDLTNHLTIEEYDLKKYLLGTIYAEEYDKLSDAYRISSTEEFVKLDFQSLEIHYWGIANFGDHHELLSKHLDFWGFTDSPYELERHAAINLLAKKTMAKNILEYGACEGILTDQLAEIAKVDCTEKSKTYKSILESKGYDVVDNPLTNHYDLVVLASFLEYLEQPKELLKKMDSKYLLIDLILESKLDHELEDTLKQYKKIDEIIIDSRWERMFFNHQKSKMPVYKLGSHCILYEKKAA